MAIVEVTTAYKTFPLEIAYGAVTGPETRTTVFEASSGHEKRNQLWSSPRIYMNVGTGITTDTLLLDLIGFFRNMAGRANSFRIKDWSDYSVADSQIGTGDGAETSFQIIKTYSSLETRNIKAAVPNTISNVTVNSVVNTDFTINLDTGIITFDTAPGLGEDIVVGACEFDIIARFDTDRLEMTLEAYRLGNAEIPVREVFA